MSHVSVHYKVILPAGHHRQPRNAQSVAEPNPPSEVDVSVPGNITPLYIPFLPHADGLAQLLFWSVTDGTNGVTYPAGPITQQVGTSPLTITAWYYPVGGDGSGESAIIDDAFSAAKGDFIDDTFVVVVSDPSLTNQANVVGVLPTKNPLALQALANVANTTEPFAKWLSFGAGSAANNLLQVPAGANGIAIAIYENSGVVFQKPDIGDVAIGGTIIGGVAVGGGGAIIVNGKPHPVDPWGPLVVSLVQASLASAGSRGLERSLGAEVQQLTRKSVMGSLKEAMVNLEKELGGKR
jgi:hypothetical protein